MSVLRDTEEVARSGVQECVARRCRGGQDDSINDVGKNRDGCGLHGNDPRRRLCSHGVFVSKVGVVARDDDSDEERAQDVEEQDSLVYG